MKELKQAVQDGNVLIGTERVMKAVKAGNLKKVFLAKNCPAEVKRDIEHYASLGSISVEQVEMDNEELGVFCKKNFFVSVIGVA